MPRTKQVDMGLTVGELINHLEKLPRDMPVGKVGHFGEFHKMDVFYFVRKIPMYLTNVYTWDSNMVENDNKLQVIDISCPDIGEDPD